MLRTDPTIDRGGVQENLHHVCQQLCLTAFMLLASLTANADPSLPVVTGDTRLLRPSLTIHRPTLSRGTPQEASHPELQASLPADFMAMKERSISVNDPMYGRKKSYVGVDLRQLLAHYGDQTVQSITFICTDGYEIALPVGKLRDPGLTAVLAYRDEEATQGNWLPYQHGREQITFEPFYLVWKNENAAMPTGLDVLPWPFRVSEIRLDRGSKTDNPFSLSEHAPQPIREGSRLFASHCMKCHQFQGAGGRLGPAFDGVASVAPVLPEPVLASMIANIDRYYDDSKMPQFSTTLSEQQITLIARFIRYQEFPQPLDQSATVTR